MKKTIILDAGHNNASDCGAAAYGTTEASEVIKIRDRLIPLLEKNFEVAIVPDDLDLTESIKWVNEKYKTLDDGLALSIHLNAGGGGNASGAEIFHYPNNEISKNIAETIIQHYCKITNFKNRGAKPDTNAAVDRLAWIRDTNPWSCLIECCFIDNIEDIKKLQNEYDKVAEAIYLGICAVYNIKSTNQEESNATEEQKQKEGKELKFKRNPLDKIFITQRFGERPDVYKQWGMAGHNGVDFRTRFDDSPDGKRKVYAVLDGVVSEAVIKIKDDYGKYVRLTHDDGSTTIYAHLDSLSVVIQQKVDAGYIIGISDNTHLTPAGSTGSHLHFGYRPSNMNWHNGYKGYEDPEFRLV